MTPQVFPLSEAPARKLLATASCSAVLCNPDICVKNLIKASSIHRDHINGQWLPIVLCQYQRGIDLKQCWTMASPYIRLVVSLIGYYFHQSITIFNTAAHLSLTALLLHVNIPRNLFCPVFKSTKTL